MPSTAEERNLVGELRVNSSTWDPDYLEVTDRSGNTIYVHGDDVRILMTLLASPFWNGKRE